MSSNVPMGASGSTLQASVLPGTLPGSFDVDETIDTVDDPYGHLERIQRVWRAKQHSEPWSKDNLSEVDLGNVDWRLYSAPTALTDAQEEAPELLQGILVSSLQNIYSRNREELQNEKNEAEARQLAEEQAAKEAQKNKEPYLPIKIVQEPEEHEQTAQDATVNAQADTEIKPDCDTGSINGGISIIQARLEKRRRFAIKGFFQRSYDKGESSAAGAAREERLKQLEHRLSKANIESTAPAAQETIAALRRHKSVRVPETQELV